MFEKPSALDNLHNKAEQYEACVQSLKKASTPSEQAKWAEIERKQYHQLLEARHQYEKENSNNLGISRRENGRTTGE